MTPKRKRGTPTTNGPDSDEQVAGFVQDLGVPGIFDVHVHFLPESMQAAVWRHFDSLPQPWGIRYRSDEPQRLRILAELGVTRFSALAYAHKPAMAAWLNDYTLGLAARQPQVIPCFTFYPEDGAENYVDDALKRGGRLAKIHLQVGKFDPMDRQLEETWGQLERLHVPVVIHAGAVPDGSGGEEWCGMDPVRRLLTRWPGLVLILAHLGAPDIADAIALAREFAQLRLDTAMVLVDGGGYRYGEPLLSFLAEAEDRILFGSDFPSFPHDYAAQVRGLVNTGLGDDWLRAVLWGNASRLFDR